MPPIYRGLRYHKKKLKKKIMLNTQGKQLIPPQKTKGVARESRVLFLACVVVWHQNKITEPLSRSLKLRYIHWSRRGPTVKRDHSFRGYTWLGLILVLQVNKFTYTIISGGSVAHYQYPPNSMQSQGSRIYFLPYQTTRNPHGNNSNHPGKPVGSEQHSRFFPYFPIFRSFFLFYLVLSNISPHIPTIPKKPTV